MFSKLSFVKVLCINRFETKGIVLFAFISKGCLLYNKVSQGFIKGIPLYEPNTRKVINVELVDDPVLKV